ncbi:unnamed protein product [Caenorhabditis bovis]|uniref:Endonuclease/exonuclease/phosphatase domain-containing protein n=1 Tax=Caenorhabditis bovis TaxID=2654633 RepID=A0A8S1ESC4_9PELO|nr:unnamed protein product [Caenorhabditis bovis]
MKSLVEYDTVKRFIMNDIPFEIVRNPPPIHCLSLPLLPSVGNIIAPAIEYNNECDLTRLKHSPICHWFVKIARDPININDEMFVNPKKNKIDTVSCTFLDEKSRTFLVDGHTYRGSGATFEPSAEDVSRKIVAIIDFGEDFPVYYAVSHFPILEYKPVITQDQVEWCGSNPTFETGPIIRVLSYNVLADHYLNLALDQPNLMFNYCPKIYQRAAYRIPLVLCQLRDFARSSVSIFFLQEVDFTRKFNYVEILFNSLGFECYHVKKGKQVNEGTIIAFDKNRFEFVSTNSFEVPDLIFDEPENEEVRRILDCSKEVKKRVMSRPTVLQIVTIRDKPTNSILMCANIHLPFNPKEEYIKPLLALVAVKKLIKEKADTTTQFPNNAVKLIFGGDFNSIPGGPVFELLTKGSIDNKHECWSLNNSIRAEHLKLPNIEPLTLLSGVPSYTNFTKDFVGSIDYIWGRDVTLYRNCPMPSHASVSEHIAIPSKTCPSDHLPIIVDVML